MKTIRIALLREHKKPADRRVALLPEHCIEAAEAYPHLEFYAQHSTDRVVSDEAYESAGVEVIEDVSACDVLMGIKEVPPSELIDNKTYFYFSHTIKKQKHNQLMLQTAARKGITLIDYECLTDEKGNRLVAFGYFAGVVGAYNALRLYEEKINPLKPAYLCSSIEEMYVLLKQRKFSGLRVLVTGTGRVGKGVEDVLKEAGFEELSPADFLTLQNTDPAATPVYTMLSSQHYNVRKSDGGYDKAEFYTQPQLYKSSFMQYAVHANMFIAAAYWNPLAPKLFELEDIAKEEFSIRYISDITCDINGSVPTTIRASSIAAPFYDIDRTTFTECAALSGDNHIHVTAIDNLPCEVPYDASKSFGEQLMKHVLPFLHTESDVIKRATILRKGKLTERFSYLEDYLHESIAT
jgi:alanine dehydrogenase